MNSIVCIKQILDPEIPAAKFKLDTTSKFVVPPEGIPPVINPYDAQAVELALRLKEKHGGKVTVITLGSQYSGSVIKHAISMGADDGIIIADDSFKDAHSFLTAYILAEAIKKIGNFDLVLCGRQAADWDEGLVGSLLAVNLELPLVTLISSAEYDGNEMKVKKVILDGYQTFAVSFPAVLTVSNEVGQPRLPSGMGIIMAARKQIPVWTARDLNIEASKLADFAGKRKLDKLFIPQRDRKCEIIQGETVAESAQKLAERLRQAGVI